MPTKKLWKKKFLFIGLIIFLFSHFNSMASEEASYDIVHKAGIYEIRHYSDRLVVQVVNKADNNSFQKLFNYISGANNNSEKIKMTVPVTQTKIEKDAFMQFYLPSKFAKDAIPTPTDPDVEIATIEEGYFAVIQYSGRSSDKNFIKYSEILKQKLLEDKISIKGLAIKATYNGPFVLPMFRRNEAMFIVSWK